MSDDKQISRDVEQELRSDPRIDEREIGIKVHGGVVTLLGSVFHYPDRFAAEEIVKRVKGVRAIANELEVKLGKPGERDDGEIATAAAEVLRSSTGLGAPPIKVVVKHGWVTLSGEVILAQQSAAAEEAIRPLPGVVGISNDIVVKAALQTGEVRQNIESAFQRQAHLDAKDILIELADCKVTLKGQVRSWRERDDAARAALDVPGVTAVDNQLRVHY